MDENPFESPDTIDDPPVEPDVVAEPGDPSAFRVPGPVALAWLLSLMLAVGLFLMVEGLFGPITGILAIAAGFLLFCRQLWAYRVSANYFAVLFLIMIAGTALAMLEQEWWRAARGTLVLLATGFILLLLMHPKARRFYYRNPE